MHLIAMFCIILFSFLISWFTDDNCYWAKKRISKMISNIEWYQIQERVENITFTHKGKEFSVHVKTLEKDNYLEKTSIWINGECVLIMYTLMGIFFNCRVMNFSKERNEFEIREIIKTASKTANKRISESIDSNIKLRLKVNSYFNNEEEK